MTAETKDETDCLERADRLIREGVRGDRGLIASMIFEAVSHEREACARIADDCQLALVAPITTEAGKHYEGGCNDASDSIARDIRARSQGSAPPDCTACVPKRD